jgi:hypothetical protein
MGPGTGNVPHAAGGFKDNCGDDEKLALKSASPARGRRKSVVDCE